ncbi:hypothetical protein HYV10_02335 [Candidatus Dependentiae bacterium]|nr:hypothetical protein [Candidatus Dependentiae bacterium]
MHKISKKILLMSIVTLCWSQVEFIYAGGDDATEITRQTDDNPEPKAKRQDEERNAFLKSMVTFRENLKEMGNKAVEHAKNKIKSTFESVRAKFSTPKQEKSISSEQTQKIDDDRKAQEEAQKKASNLVNKIDLTKNINKQEADITNGLNTITDKSFITNPLQEKINLLDSEKFLTLDPSYIKYISTDKLSKFKEINYLSPGQFEALTPEQLNALTPEVMLKLSPKKFNELSANNIKSILAKPTLIKDLTPEQIQALNPDALAAAIKGENSWLGKKWLGKNPLPQEFIDALTPEQAIEILNTRSFKSDHKFYFTDAQLNHLLVDKLSNEIKRLKQELTKEKEARMLEMTSRAYDTFKRTGFGLRKPTSQESKSTRKK